jgi:tripartite-type tricarboxylate transporter receptor subunit TctC
MTFAGSRLKAGILVCLAALTASVVPAAAQTYPDKPIKLVLPYQPGGIIDFVGRAVAQRLSEVLGQQVVAENRSGAGGMVGVSAVTRAAPDGYTLLIMDPALVINPSLHKDVPYSLKELRPVSIVGSSPLLMVVTPQMQAKTFQEFMALGKKSGANLNYASAGIGTTPHLAGELFKLRTKIDAAHVPYRGSGPSIPDLMSGKVHFAFNALVVVRAYIADDRLRVLGVAGPKRIESLPDLPTMAELGMPDFDVNLWVGLFAPKDVPDDIVQRLNGAVKQAIGNEGLRSAYAKMGVEPVSTGVQESEAFIQSEFEKWADVIAKANVKPE